MQISATNQKITWFKREDSAGTLDLAPAFQRRPVWSDDQASYLIDTILSGLPFPEIYVRSTSTPAGETRHEVVDGQQRIRSILRFGRNDLALCGEDVSPRWIGKSFEDLSDNEKSSYWNYEVVVRDLGGASDGAIRDLFRRLNINSVILTDQELRHAKYKGAFIKLMEKLADDEWWIDMRIVNPRQIRRMEDVEYISELFIGLIAGPQDKKSTLGDYYDDYETEMPDGVSWEADFNRTRELLASVLDEKEIRSWSGKSDFYSLFLAVGGFTEKDLRPVQRREVVGKKLMDFRISVDRAKKKTNTRRFSHEVHDYADAVTRAATDAGRRTRRLQILEGLISAAIGKGVKKAG